MKKISRNEQIMLVVLVGFMSLYFFSKKVRDPLSDEISDLIKRNNTLVEKVMDLRNNPVETAGVRRAIAELEEEIEPVEAEHRTVLFTSLALRDRVDEAALSISGIAADNGLEVSRFSPVERVSGLTSTMERWRGSFSLVPYRFEAKGSYMDWVKFLSELLQRESIVVVGSTKIHSPTETGVVTIETFILL